MNHLYSMCSWLRCSPIPCRCANVILITLVAVAWSSLASSCGRRVVNTVESGEFGDAVNDGKMETVKAMLTSNPDLVHSTYEGWTPLCYAAKNGLKDIAELLLARGAEINVKNDEGQTPLFLAGTG